MQAPTLHVASEIVDGLESLWVSSESTVIHLSIEVESGRVIDFSCRLGTGIVAEMGEVINALSGERYPSLCIFAEDENHNSSPQQFCQKHDGVWHIEF